MTIHNTLQNIKDEYYVNLSLGVIDTGFEEYLTKNYRQDYDINNNFLGYVSKQTWSSI